MTEKKTDGASIIAQARAEGRSPLAALVEAGLLSWAEVLEYVSTEDILAALRRQEATGEDPQS